METVELLYDAIERKRSSGLIIHVLSLLIWVGSIDETKINRGHVERETEARQLTAETRVGWVFRIGSRPRTWSQLRL
jgi:hypothetical protein